MGHMHGDRKRLGNRDRHLFAHQLHGDLVGPCVFRQRQPKKIRRWMTDVAKARQHLRGDGLPGLRVLAFFRFQLHDGAIVEPRARNRGEHARGIPGGGPDRSLEGRHLIQRRSDETYAQAGGDTLG
ncbi:hypothetical protein D3C86_1817450 [compost metagenome]